MSTLNLFSYVHTKSLGILACCTYCIITFQDYISNVVQGLIFRLLINILSVNVNVNCFVKCISSGWILMIVTFTILQHQHFYFIFDVVNVMYSYRNCGVVMHHNDAYKSLISSDLFEQHVNVLDSSRPSYLLSYSSSLT